MNRDQVSFSANKSLKYIVTYMCAMRCDTYFEVIMKVCSIKRHKWRSIKIMDGISNFVGSHTISRHEISFVTKMDRLTF
jgi:hypothetical protein